MNIILVLYKGDIRILPIFLFALLLAGASGRLNAHNGAPSEETEEFWTRIQARLDQSSADTSLQFIPRQVRRHCLRDLNCCYQTYRYIMFKLERRFDLPAAIFVGEELAETGRRQKEPEAEAGAYLNLARYHNALGNKRQATLNFDKALKLFKKAGNHHAVVNVRMSQLEQSLSYRKIEEVLPEMNALLAESITARDSLSIRFLNTRMVEHALNAGRYEQAAQHIAALEDIPISHPIKPQEYKYVIIAARGKARLAEMRNDWEEARRHYQEALHYCREEPSRWLEIHILQAIAEIEWEQDRVAAAESYLDSAYAKAQRLELHDLLTRNFELKAAIAESEGRYAEALAYLKQKQFHKEAFDRRSAGFDVRNHYLQLEKEQLATEKRNKDLELQLKKTQLRNYLIITGLALLLAVVLVFAFLSQRERKKELTRQNRLVRKQAERLKNLDAAKSRFFANVSHELRTPLTLMLGPVSALLKEKKLTDKQTRLLKMADRSGKQLEQLVTEILDLGKLEMGKMSLDEQPTGLSSFFRSYFVQFESLARSRQIDYSFNIALDDRLVAGIDRAKCRQILYNLLSNAFKFTPAGGRIEAGLSVEDGVLKLTVADSGPGIHPDDLPHLFDRYFQTSRPGQPADGGTGIGLALCQEYAKLFGGKIEVESEPGNGALFRVCFPVSLPDQAECSPGSEASIASKSQKESKAGEEATTPPVSDDSVQGASLPVAGTPKSTILVVEDNLELRNYLCLILSEKYHVLTAENGQEAIEQLAAEQLAVGSATQAANCQLPTANCQLILSDLMMPVMDGYQLLEKLKAGDDTRHIPVIMLTARADISDKLKALRIGVDDYLLKPFNEEELLARVANLLKNQMARREEIPELEEEALQMPEPDREWLKTFESYVQKHIANDTLTVPVLASEFAMSESTLLRQLKRLTGLSPLKYMQEIRLHQARRLLENRSHRSVAAVATKVGYTDARSFSRTFRKRFGKLPSEFLAD